MPNRSTDALFQLVHSLEKSEKRNFRLYVTRNTSSTDLKIIQLFDVLDKMSEYDETILLKKAPSLTKLQWAGLMMQPGTTCWKGYANALPMQRPCW